MPEILVVTRNLGLQNSLEKQFRLKINSSCFNNTYLHFFPPNLLFQRLISGWTETPNFWYPKHITIGSRLIDFSLYWNWCRWFSVLLLCKSNSYVLEMMNDEVLGMECTSLFLLFFSWKWKFEKVRSCSFFRYMPPHKQYYVHAQHVLTFTYLDFSDGNVSCNLTETVNIFKYFTICIFFLFILKKLIEWWVFFQSS